MMHVFGHAGRWESTHSPADLRSGIPHSLRWSELPASGFGVAAPNPLHRGNTLLSLSGEPVWVQGSSYRKATPGEVLDAYLECGESLLDGLRGRFALVIGDAARRRVVLAVDPMGIERMCWASGREGIVFSDSAEAVAAFPALRAPVRPQAIHDFLLLHMIPAPATAYEGVYKLEPGTALVFEDGRATVQRYWMPSFVEEVRQPVAALEAQLRDCLASAVRRCEPGPGTGAFLSGGLDSSTVAGMLGRVSGRPARTFSIGFGVESHDEIGYARISARHFGCDASEYNVIADDIVSSFAQIAAAYDEPFGNSSALPTLYCAKLAATAGVDCLLAGDGGDEIFGGNERYARQRVFETYGHLPRWLRRGVLEPLGDAIADDSTITPLRKLRSYVQQAKIPLPERLETWNFFYRTPHARIFEPSFAARIDIRSPIEAMRTVYESIGDCTLLNRMLHYDWHYTLADSDLRKVNTMCGLAGIRVSYPMLDPEVIDLSLRVPSRLKMQGRELRSFFKRTMRGFLPDAVIDKPKHGFGLPFGHWLKTHGALRDMILGLLRRLEDRGIVRPEFLRQIIAEHEKGEAGYYGYAIWDFAMLEAWLEAHRPAGL